MNGPLLAEAADVLFVTCRALAYWIAAISFVIAVVVLAGLGTGAWAVRGLWRHTAGPAWGRSRLGARLHTARRARAARGRTADPEYQEAA
ncbi:hypothetical protein ACFYRN_45170 [Streptomyces sp. NPDC005227]|uniref:hypothetical protein n=1 Tax=Streptomyces sp. NPDC005227 TaxID=3364707 RepID=UPI0036BF2EEE